jgi:hypothetical protein
MFILYVILVVAIAVSVLYLIGVGVPGRAAGKRS